MDCLGQLLMALTLSRYQHLWTHYPDLVAAGLCGLLVALGALLLAFNWVGVGLLCLFSAYGIGGFESTRAGLTTLWHEHELDVDLLMIIAALGAATLGIWQQDYYLVVDGGVLILIFAMSGALEDYALRRTDREIRSLMQLTPDTARLWQPDHEQVIPVSQLQVGDRILVKPGELIPTDGLVQSGFSTLNQAAITGESLPVEKQVGDTVFGGTLNGQGALVIQIHQPPESSLIQRVVQLVQVAQTTAPPSQQFIERFERSYARVIVISGVLLALLPVWFLNWTWETTIYRSLIFLVVASPCALMAAIMPTLVSGIAAGSRQGILFKSGSQLELLGQVKAIAFDKTGTLTTGVLTVTDIIPAAGYTEEQVLQLAAAVEVHSEHPIGQAILTKARAGQLTWDLATETQAYPGQGIWGSVNNQSVWIGKVLDQRLSSNLARKAFRLEQIGHTVVGVSQQDQLIGLIAASDTVRPQAKQALRSLRQLGIEHMVMMTGDHQYTAQTIASIVGVDRVAAQLLPEDKVKQIQALQQIYGTVAMVGDGINDAPALAQASVGVAMGRSGTDLALETADVVLMSDQLEKLAMAVDLGRQSQRIIRQNIVLALASVVILLIANFGWQISLPLGVLGHEGSTLLVTLNGLRLLGYQKQRLISDGDDLDLLTQLGKP